MVKTVLKILKWLGVVVLFIALLEVWARVDDMVTWGAPFSANYTHETLRVADMKGFHNRPNAQFQKWKINSHGFRGPEITVEKPTGVTRILVLGASETFGLHESPRMEFPSQMQTILDSTHPGRYQVINAACVGLTPPRIRHYFQSWLYQFEPDIVAYYPSPGFYLDVDPVPDSTDWAYVSQWRPSEEWRLVGKMKIVLKNFIPMSWQIPLQNWRLERIREGRPEGWIFQQVPTDRIELLNRQVTEMIEKILESGASVLLSTHVERFGDSLTTADKRHLLGGNRFYPRASQNVMLTIDSAANQTYREIGERLGVPVIEMIEHIPPEPQYFADASHFTNEGARKAAEAFAAAVVRMLEESAQLESGSSQ